MLSIVVIDEETNGDFMHLIGFGKGECAAHEARGALAQGEISAFEVVGGAAFLAAAVLFGRHHLSISRPEVAVTKAVFVIFGNASPQDATGRFASVAQSVSHDLSSATVLHDEARAAMITMSHASLFKHTSLN